MKTMNVLIISSLVLLVSACGEDTLSVPKSQVRPVKLFEVSGGTAKDVREFAGRVAAADVSTLSFRIGGEIVDLPVQNGQEVMAGEVLARLDASSIASALENAQAQFDLALADHKRKKNLYDQRVISKSSYDRAYTSLVSSRTALDIAKDNLSYTAIFAPYSGVVGKVSVENHEVVGPNQPVMTVQGQDAIEITVQMPESIVANVRPQGEIDGYQPQAWFTSNPNKTYPVIYKENAAEANRGSQTYDVTFTLDRPDDLQLLPGMSATVAIDIAHITREGDGERIVIPTSAITQVDGATEAYAWRFQGETETVAKVAVELGRVTDDGIEILSGLSNGDRVVSAGLSEMSEGMTVKAWTQERGL